VNLRSCCRWRSGTFCFRNAGYCALQSLYLRPEIGFLKETRFLVLGGKFRSAVIPFVRINWLNVCPYCLYARADRLNDEAYCLFASSNCLNDEAYCLFASSNWLNDEAYCLFASSNWLNVRRIWLFVPTITLFVQTIAQIPPKYTEIINQYQ
jgi:hypothetical protein